jgi:hypothetical protein
MRFSVVALEAPLGQLPPDDRIGSYMSILAAILPQTAAYPPEYLSELARFDWSGRPAAVFLRYSAGGGGLPAYYVRWWGLELDSERALLMEQAASLSPGAGPSAATLAQFDQALGALRLNGEALAAEDWPAALARLTDPYGQAGPPVAALRLETGLEVRLALPPDWFRRDVSREADYPSQYLFENDPRTIPEGGTLRGAVAQISLISPGRLARLLDQDSPPDSDWGLAYLNTLLALTPSGISPGLPSEYPWGEGRAYSLFLTYPPGLGFHADGTQQHFVLLEQPGGLVMLTFYAPSNRWADLRPLWQNILGALQVNGGALPSDLVAQLFSQEAP